MGLLCDERINPKVKVKVKNCGKARNAILGGDMGIKERTRGEIECN